MTDRAARRLPIRVVLIAGFFLIAGASIVFMSAERYIWMTGTLEREERDQDVAVARAVAAGLDRFVETTRHVAEGLAAEIAEQRLLERPAVLQQVVENATHRELTFTVLAVTDDAGKAVAFSPRVNGKGATNIGMRLSDRQWFKDAMAAPAQPSLDVVMSRVDGRPAIGVAAPIRARGRILGVVVEGVDLQQLRRVVRDVDPARMDRLVVVDARGRVIAHSSPEWEAEAHDLSSEAVFRAAQSRGEGTTDYASQYTGTTRVAGFVRMPSTGWVVWASRGPEARRDKMAALLQALLWSGFAAAVIATVGAVGISRVVARPLTDLARAFQRLASGRFEDARIAPTRGSKIREFDELLRGFRTMADRLRLQHEDLEAQVSDRTRALTEAVREAQAAAALLRAEEEIRRGYGELAALLNSLDRSYILHEGAKKIRATLHAPVVAVYLTEDGPSDLRLKTYSALDATVLDTRLLTASGFPRHLAEHGDAIVIALPHSAEPLQLQTGVGLISIAAVAGFPLRYQERLMGALVAALLEPPTEQVRSFLENSARQLSVALNNAGLFESIRLQSQRMEQLNAELRQVGAAKSEFLASMSHELRTPLNSILGFTDLLLMPDRDALSSRQRTALEKVRASGHHLLELINQVLDLAKIEAGRMELHPEGFALGALIEECLSEVEPQAQRTGVTLRREAPGEPVDVEQDRMKVKQILLNLLSNAIKFTAEGVVEVRLSAERDGVRIAVIDSGVGIDPADQATIFEEFRQVAGRNGRSEGGTGLGLAISRRLAHRLGGTLTVTSAVGAGSTFTLRLPRACAPDGSRKAGDEAPGEDGTSRILVIDDDRDVAEIIREVLAQDGIAVDWAATGAEGLARARGSRPRAILLDVVLQGEHDGWEMLRTLKADPTTRAIPVVIHSVIDNPERAAQLGAADVLVKPVSAPVLRARLTPLVSAPTAASYD